MGHEALLPHQETMRLGDIERFIRETDAATTIDAIHTATQRQTIALGFEYFGYQLLAPPIGPPVRLYLTSKPKEWVARYIAQSYISDDLVSRHAARTIRPFLWDEITPERIQTPTQRLIFHEAAECGLQSGATVPIHGPGTAKALFSVSNRMPKAEFAKLFLAERHPLQLIATYVHEHLLRLGIQNPPPLPTIKLTPRELEVLTWTARGKTAWETSQILTLSEATVREYGNQACAKLGTNSKTHAVAIAILHALIIP